MTDELIQEDELTLLKERADLLGISYHPSIKLEKLKAKIEEATGSDDEKEEPVVTKKKLTRNEMRKKILEEANKLVRVNVTCMDPAKKDWEGEFFSVSNSVMGTITKYVKYNTDNGWHVPKCIVDMLRDKTSQVFVTVKQNGQETRKGKSIKSFAIETLPQLTKEELSDLAKVQAASGSIEQ